MTIRKRGRDILQTVVKNSKNLTKLESTVWKFCSAEDEDKREDMYTTLVYQVYGDILNGVSLKQLTEYIKKGENMFLHPCFAEFRKWTQEKFDFIVNPFEVEEGVQECRAILKKGPRKGEVCGSKKTFSFEKQTRSADEPTTVFSRCSSCGNKWSYSG